MLLFCVISFIILLIALYVIIELNYKGDPPPLVKDGVLHFPSGYMRLVKFLYSKRSILDGFQAQYNSLREAGVEFGKTNEFGKESYTIIDTKVLKNILVKDFDHFFDRRSFFQNSDTFMGKALVFLNGGEWKSLRTKLTPTFTTGKIKRLFPLFDESAKKLMTYIREKCKTEEGREIDMMNGYSKFTMDVIASAVCGIDSQAFHQDEPSLFESMGKNLQVTFSPLLILRVILLVQFPHLASFLGIRMFDRKTEDFFQDAIVERISSRTESGIGREDFLQIMLEARQGKIKVEESELNSFEKDAQLKESTSSSEFKMSDDMIAANCLIFFLAGYDVTQSLLVFCTYALAINPEIQERVREEVDSILEENNGEFTHEALGRMKYLDMVLSETQRMYPTLTLTDRCCTSDYQIPGTQITIKKGEIVKIPIYNIHHDERYYPEPEKFDPERFSPQRKGDIDPYSFLTFGQGPRNCIGNLYPCLK